MAERHGLVILGRDGVVNELVEGGLRSSQDWQPIPLSIGAIARLCRAGFHVAVVTNQQGLSKRLLDIEALHDIHERMLAGVREAGGQIDAIVFASGGRKDGHGDRQPKVRLISDLMKRFQVSAATTVLIGDSREDMEAASHLGLRAILLQTGAGADSLRELASFDGVTVHTHLAAAADALIGEREATLM